MRSDAKASDIKLAVGRALAARFDKSDWIELGLMLDKEDLIGNHPRLLRSLDFGDDDYQGAVFQIVSELLGEKRTSTSTRFTNLAEVAEFIGLEEWLKANQAHLYQKLYGNDPSLDGAVPPRPKLWGADPSPTGLIGEGPSPIPGPNPVKEKSMKREVFLVHGRDPVAREQLVNLLKAFDLRIIDWERAAAATGVATPDTMAIIEAGMDEADVTVVLFTPDDVGNVKPEFASSKDPSHEVDPTGQARLNVVFEAGMAWARDRRTVVLVEVGSVRPMSDTVGVNVTRLKNSDDSRKSLGKRLRTAGLDINLEEDDWRGVGDFSPRATEQALETGTWRSQQ